MKKEETADMTDVLQESAAKDTVTDVTAANPEGGEKRPSENPYLKKRRLSLRQLTIIGLLAAVTLVLGMTPFGLIRIPPINATTLHIPTIIAAILEGPRAGVAVGFVFGSYSLFQNMVAPNIMSMFFLNPLVSVLPRMLFGPLAYLVYRLIPLKRDFIRITLSAFIGTLLHTTMVMGAIYFLYKDEYASLKNMPVENVVNIIVGVAISHGTMEAVVAALLVTPVVIVAKKALRKK